MATIDFPTAIRNFHRVEFTPDAAGLAARDITGTIYDRSSNSLRSILDADTNSIASADAWNLLKSSFGSASVVERGILASREAHRAAAGDAPYIYQQEVGPSQLVLGPLHFNHSVQDVNLVEARSVESVQTTRSQKGVLIDKGSSDQRVVVRLLFSGVDEINNGLRPLALLFRICPILTVKNELISESWKIQNPDVASLNNRRIRDFLLANADSITQSTREVFSDVTDFRSDTVIDDLRSVVSADRISSERIARRVDSVSDGSFFTTLLDDYRKQQSLKVQSTSAFQNRVRESFEDIKVGVIVRQNPVQTEHIPVAFESLSIQNAPDLVDSYFVTITLARVDVSSATGGVLQWQGQEPGDFSPSPTSAFWLKKWLRRKLKELPVISQRDSRGIEFEWLAQDLLGGSISVPKADRYRNNVITFATVGKEDDFINEGTPSAVAGFSYTLTNYFGYQKMHGKSVPCVHHMGTSARSVSVDLIFDTSSRAALDSWEKFLKFKELADEYVRSSSRLNRLTGWNVYHPILAILGIPRAKNESAGVFVPLATQIKTGDVPHLKYVSMDLMENNLDFVKDQEIVLHQGATEEVDLRSFYDRLLEDEQIYREISFGQGGDRRRAGDLFYAYETVWPTKLNRVQLANTSQASIVNLDTLRAVLVQPNFDVADTSLPPVTPGATKTLVELLRTVPLATGSLGVKRNVGAIQAVFESWQNVTITSSPETLVKTGNSYDRVYAKIRGLVVKSFDASSHTRADFDAFVNSLTQKIFIGFLGDRDHVNPLNLLGFGTNLSASGQAVQDIGTSGFKLSQEFKDALFELVTRRPPPPRNLPFVYKNSGIESAFLALWVKYSTQRDRVLDPEIGPPRDIYDNPEPDRRHSLYRDMMLPTYIDLYGKEYFEKFAPTFDDLGLNPWLFNQQSRLTSQQDNREKIAVFYQDTIHPAAWFHSNRYKPVLRAEAEKDIQTMWNSGSKLDLSIPFNTTDIAEAAGLDPNDMDAIRRFVNDGTVSASIEETMAILANRRLQESSGATQLESGIVLSVSDGDSFKVNLQQSGQEVDVRLLGVDTPEREERKAQLAKELLEGMLPLGTTVNLIYSPNNVDRSGRGALLAYVYNINGENVNEVMAQSGYVTNIPLFNLKNPQSEKAKDRANKLRITLSKMIRDTVEAYKREDPAGFQLDIEQLSYIASKEEYRRKYLGPNATHNLYLYLHHNDNHVLRTKAKSGFLGSETYQVLSDLGFLELSEGTVPGRTDQHMVSALPATSHRFIRNQQESTTATVQSNLDQIPDDFESPVKLWPAIKVYLIDHRGNDIIADDAMFSVNPIVSCDITLDKNDADLAVLRIADPLYTLQGDYFPLSNVVGSGDRKRVLGSLKNRDFNSYLRRHKIAQGRSIQIRMGYDSVAENLKTVFTGRITEIQPGDVLTLVCQGWKAELISRKVAFSISDPIGWGAQDLCIQAVQEANPAGIGQHFPQRDANFVLKNLRDLDQESVVRQIQNVQHNSSGVFGTVTTAEQIAHAGFTFGGFLNVAEPEKRLKGLDTRLKNIWYPDIPTYSNTLSWRSRTRVMPEYINDGWVIPLQPAWEAIKEASRHAWNCIAQVVPYDGEATLFFGQPDQPYFYTRGPGVSNSKYRRYANTQRDIQDGNLETAVVEFLGSKQYDVDVNRRYEQRFLDVIEQIVGRNKKNSLQGLFSGDTQLLPPDLLSNPRDLRMAFTPTPHVGGIHPRDEQRLQLEMHRFLTEIRNIETGDYLQPTLALAFKALGSPSRNSVALAYDQSSLPATAYADLLRKYGSGTGTMLVRLFYGAPTQFLNRQWPSLHSSLPILLGPGVLESAAPGNTVLRNEVIPRVAGISDLPIEVNRGVINQGEVENIELLPAKSSILGNLRRNGTVSSGRALPSQFIGINQVSFDDLVLDYLPEFKAFVYYFWLFLQSRPSGRTTSTAQSLASAMTAQNRAGLEPNMQVFRVHHWMDSDHHIIKNNVVATTSQMWNTVSVEHPEQTNLANTLKGDVHNPAKVHAGVEWVYYPKQEITKVHGLQFHPGLTLANKKIEIKTELNCHSEELAAKLACIHLADGVRRMYRGTLLVRGQVIKPHDRIILRDNYNDINGPVEVESVVHHWEPSMGWVTNIAPQAVCDANPGAAALQTASLEATYNKTFGVIDTAFDVFFWTVVIASLGSGAGVAFGVRSGLSAVAKSLVKKSGFKKLLRANLDRGKRAATGIIGAGVNPLSLYRALAANFGGLGIALAKGAFVAEGAELTAAIARRFTVINAFAAAHDPDGLRTAEQLPVTLSPLMYQGLPWTAGLEADESIYAMHFADTFYAVRDLLLGLESFHEAEESDLETVLEEMNR